MMRWFSFLLVFLLVFTACGGNDDDQADTIAVPTPTPSPATATLGPTQPELTPTAEPTVTLEPTSTPEPEVSAEASTEIPAPTETTEPTPTITESTATETVAESSEGESEDGLAGSLLLQLEDMPAGWSPSDIHIDDEEDDDEDSFICDTPPLREELDSTGSAEASFGKGQLGPWVEQFVGILDTEDAAIEGMAYIRGAFTCSEWTTTDDDGEPVVWQFQPVSFPVIGDETFVTRALVDSGGFTFEVDLVIFRESRAICVLLNLGLTINPDETLAISEAAAQRIGDGL